MESLIPDIAAARDTLFRQLTDTLFDALIIGGGITGAGIAWQLARWGIKVALVEQEDFAAGTSSRSSKLIHGGFRYLPHGEFRLVHQVAQERTRLARLMPHLIKPMSMTVPAYRGGAYPLPLLSFGSWLYDRLGPMDRKHGPVRLNIAGVQTHVPGIALDGLRGGISYYEFTGHDARITWSVINTAIQLGATCLNHVQAHLDKSHLIPNGISEVAVHDQWSGTVGSVKTRIVINAAGPWADSLDANAHLVRSRGIHLAFLHQRLPLTGATVIPTPENANVFAVPRGPITYIGTTDQLDQNLIDRPALSMDDAQYLLDAANHTFPGIGLKGSDVIAAWSGVRPLIAADAGTKTDRLSRRDMILPGPSLITVLGGKFTGFRATAESVVRTALPRLGGVGSTPAPELIANAPPQASISALTGKISSTYRLAEEWAESLIERYGTAAEELLAKSSHDDLAPVLPNIPLLNAEVDWAVLRERALTVADVLIRRTGLAWLGGIAPAQLMDLAQSTADRMRDLLNWSVEERAHQLTAFYQAAYLDEVQNLRSDPS